MLIAEKNLNGFRDTLEIKPSSNPISQKETNFVKKNPSGFDKAFEELNTGFISRGSTNELNPFTGDDKNPSNNSSSTNELNPFTSDDKNAVRETKEEGKNKDFSLEKKDEFAVNNNEKIQENTKDVNSNTVHDKVEELSEKAHHIKETAKKEKTPESQLKNVEEMLSHIKEMLHFLSLHENSKAFSVNELNTLKNSISNLKNVLKDFNFKTIPFAQTAKLQGLFGKVQNKLQELLSKMNTAKKEDQSLFLLKGLDLNKESVLAKMQVNSHNHIQGTHNKAENNVNIQALLYQPKEQNIQPFTHNSMGKQTVQTQPLNHITVHNNAVHNITGSGNSAEGKSFNQNNSDSNNANNMLQNLGFGKTSGHSSIGASTTSNDFANKMELGKSILNQLGDSIKGYVGKNQSHFTIQLNPEDLGKVKIVLDMKNDKISGNIIVENEQVREIIKERFSEMKSLFQSSGVNLSELNVQTQAEYKQNQNQNNNAQTFFDIHKEAATGVKINRELNFEKAPIEYEKTLDNQYTNGKFAITI